MEIYNFFNDDSKWKKTNEIDFTQIPRIYHFGLWWKKKHSAYCRVKFSFFSCRGSLQSFRLFFTRRTNGISIGNSTIHSRKPNHQLFPSRYFILYMPTPISFMLFPNEWKKNRFRVNNNKRSGWFRDRPLSYKLSTKFENRFIRRVILFSHRILNLVTHYNSPF